MTEDEVRRLLEPFLLEGKTLNAETSAHLWKLGYVEVQDVTDRDTRPIGRKEYMATKLTPKGRRLMAYLRPGE